MEPLRVLLVDDHPVFLDGLCLLVDAMTNAVVAGTAHDGAEAVEAAVRLRPDVVLMDLHLPVMNGVEATREIVRQVPETRVLVLTMFDDDESVVAAMRAGARGYLLKGAGSAQVSRAVEAVAAGEAVFGSAVAQHVIDFFTAPRRAPGRAAFPQLTEREREVLELMASGSSNPEIARKLVISPKTVRNHVSNIFSKLQVNDRAQAIVRARTAGLGEDRANPL